MTKTSTSSNQRVLFRGGEVHSPADPFATSMLVDGDSIAWVGSDEAADMFGDVRVVDLDGALVTPGFVDAHAHVTETGLSLEGLSLDDATSVQQVLDRVAEAARATSDATVVTGTGWDESRWSDPRPPTAQELDRASGNRKVFLARVDVHSAAVSGTLIAEAGLSSLAGFDESGLVTKDAHDRARRAARALTPSRRAEVQRAALEHAASRGVVALHEMSAPGISGNDDLAVLIRLCESAQDLPEVMFYSGQLVGSVEEAQALRATLPGLRGLAGDLCADGSIGSGTAAFRAPYLGGATPAAPYLSAEQVSKHVQGSTQAGLQAGFHVIGDAALDVVLDGFERATAALGTAAVGSAGHRLEHVVTADDDQIARLVRLGLLVSVQPAFDAAWGGDSGMYADRVGAQRSARMNRIGSMIGSGVPLALGSDCPVTPLDPWGSIRAAVFHSSPAERISARAAFTAHTRGGWRAAGEHGKGVIAPGQPASFAVWAAGDLIVQAADDRLASWSTDPRSGTPGLPDLSDPHFRPRCLLTVRDGVTLFADNSFGAP
ncbi:amidohydrolase [Saxibacter everestensis]|uniref:Amidohydrolase n=1 Tax=Saxibacter everestensis TaxID=2909229 RepID=A0ABY8QZH8_9MICO|nr:amidohydrolase [Brevibacteriaceae bacterium ZFBP1038]